MNHDVRTQVAQAEKVLREQQAEREKQPAEYTVVANDPAYHDDASIAIYARTYEPTWTFIKDHNGKDAEALVAALEGTNARVTLVTNSPHLQSVNGWRKTVVAFRASTVEEALTTKISRLRNRAAAYDQEWAHNDRWGPGPGGSLRADADALEAELTEMTKETEPEKRKKFKPKNVKTREPVKGWYLDQ